MYSAGKVDTMLPKLASAKGSCWARPCRLRNRTGDALAGFWRHPVLLAVTVFHIVYAWNDFFGPLIYLSTNRAAWPVSVALNTFNGIYGQKPQLIQAGALMTLLLPLLLFIFAQRFFVQGIVITGVDK